MATLSTSLASLRTKLRYAIDHNPDLKTWKDHEEDVLNDALMALCSASPWLFLHRDWRFTTSAVVEGSATVTCSVTNDSYTVTVSGVAPETTWEGQTFEGPDGKLYEIARITVSNSSSGALYLMTRYAGDTSSGDSSFYIRFLAYALPVDCEEPLEFIDETTGRPVGFVDRTRDAGYGYRRELAGKPVLFVDTIQKTDRGPDTAPTLAVTGTGDNALLASTKYEVCYTFTMAGRESPMSPVATATTTAGNKTIAVTGLENTADLTDLTGWWKNVYIRDVTRNGRWLKYVSDIGETTTTATLDNVADISRRDFNELFTASPFRQYVRTDPPATDAYNYTVRYVGKVRRLVADNDVVPIPDPYGNAVFYVAVRHMCLSIGAERLWQAWKVEADALMRSMAERWLTREATSRQRQPITMAMFPNESVPMWYWGQTARWTG